MTPTTTLPPPSAPAGGYVGITATQTLTNKTLTAPVVNSPTGIVKGDVGLGSVTNDAQLKASDLDTDGTLAANSASKIPAQSAVRTYVAANGAPAGLAADGAEVTALKHGTAAQTFRIYKTYTDASNYSRMAIAVGVGGANISFVIEESGTGVGGLTYYGFQGGPILTGTWQATPVADNYITSAATWNAKQAALTFPLSDSLIASAATWNAKAPIASPTFTGNVTFPLAVINADGSTLLANGLFGVGTDGSISSVGSASLANGAFTVGIDGTVQISGGSIALLLPGFSGFLSNFQISWDVDGNITAPSFTGTGTIHADTGWVANADAGDKTKVIPASAGNATVATALNIVTAGAGTLLLNTAEKVKAIESALASFLAPNE